MKTITEIKRNLLELRDELSIIHGPQRVADKLGDITNDIIQLENASKISSMTFLGDKPNKLIGTTDNEILVAKAIVLATRVDIYKLHRVTIIKHGEI